MASEPNNQRLPQRHINHAPTFIGDETRFYSFAKAPYRYAGLICERQDVDRPYRFCDTVFVCRFTPTRGSANHAEGFVHTSAIADRLNHGDRWVDKGKFRDWPSLRTVPDGSSARDSKVNKTDGRAASAKQLSKQFKGREAVFGIARVALSPGERGVPHV